jgi:competence protein CoiA
MLYAINELKEKSLPTKNKHFFCPCCESKVVAKMGQIKTHHWAHSTTEINCDSKPMSEWHIEWQSHFPKENVEIYVNKKRRADVLLKDNCVVEFQNSPISISDVLKRSTIANDGIIWVHNVIDQNVNKHFVSSEKIKDNLYHGCWKHPMMIFDRQTFRGEEIWLQFSETSLGKLCWVDYSKKPFASISFYLTSKKEFLERLLKLV